MQTKHVIITFFHLPWKIPQYFFVVYDDLIFLKNLLINKYNFSNNRSCNLQNPNLIKVLQIF